MISAEAADSFRRLIPAETKRGILDKLLRGRESTVQLQSLLRSATATDLHRLTLADEIYTLFTEAISVLHSPDSAADEITCPDHSLCSDLDSGSSRRSQAVKDLAPGNKKRRLENRRIVTSATTEDGHAWRKYGQKVIHNTTHPRSYYRCTQKYEQNCEATKHVQRMEGDSETYKITYISNHTCGPASPIAFAETPTSASDSHNICFSAADSGNDHCFWPSDGDIATRGDSTIGEADEIDRWLNLKDFGSFQETPMTNQYYFSTGDDAKSDPMFWSQFNP